MARDIREEILLEASRISLTKTESGILEFLASTPGRVFTRQEIIRGVHGEDYPASDRSVDVQILGLRRKLGPLGRYIETVRTRGFRLKAAQ